MKTQRILTILFVSALFVGAVVYLGRQSGPAGGGINLLKRVPANAAVVFHSNLETPRAEAFLRSPLAGALSDFQKSASSSTENLPATVQEQLKFSTAMQKAGLYDASHPGGGIAVENVLFVMAAAQEPTMTSLLRTRAGVSTTDVLNHAEQELKAAQFETTRAHDGPYDTLSMTLSQSSSGGMPGLGTHPVMYASDGFIALASNAALARAAFTDQTASILESPDFQVALKTLNDPDDRFGVLYVNPAQAAPLLKLAAAEMPQNVEQNAALVDGLAHQLKSLVAKFGFSNDVGATYDVAITLNDINGKPAIPSTFITNGHLDILSKTPAQAVLVLALDAAIINPIIQARLDTQEPQMKAMLENSGALSFSEIMLGLSQPSGAAPFPEIFVSAKSPKAATVLEVVKSAINVAAQKQGMPALPWQQSKIGSTDVNSFVTPLGVGAFLAALPDRVLLTSSAAAMTALIDENSGTAVMTESRPKGSFVGGYMSFPKLFELAESLKGTLSMFMGGAAGMDTAKYAYLKKFGIGSFNTSIDGSVVRIHATLGK